MCELPAPILTRVFLVEFRAVEILFSYECHEDKVQLEEKIHELEKKAPAQPELSSRSDFRACFVVVVRISYDPVTSTILEQDLREF